MVIIALLLCGCAKNAAPVQAGFVLPAPVARAADRTLLPLIDGNTWVYEYDSIVSQGTRILDESTGLINFRVSQVSQSGDTTRGLITITQDEKVLSRCTWQEDQSGIFQLTNGTDNTPFTQPEPLFKFPFVDRSKSSWQVRGIAADNEYSAIEGSTEYTTADQIDTAVGTVSGYQSIINSTFKSAKLKGTEYESTWFQPGVGIVRLLERTTVGARSIETTIRLKSTILMQ